MNIWSGKFNTVAVYTVVTLTHNKSTSVLAKKSFSRTPTGCGEQQQTNT